MISSKKRYVVSLLLSLSFSVSYFGSSVQNAPFMQANLQKNKQPPAFLSRIAENLQTKSDMILKVISASLE
jgi:hypothetical protein